jgi:deoxyribonuclease-2
MLNAIGDSAQAVDWWFAYKLPRDARSPNKTSTTKPSTGFEYLYFDNRSTKLKRSINLINSKGGALYNTLKQLYPLKNNPNKSLGWIIYNDERSDGTADNGELGHTKGVLAFDAKTNSAFWLLHSTPRFSVLTGADFPEDEKDYAQTYLCITLKDFDTAQQIAELMCHQQEPQVFSHNLPAGIKTDSPLCKLTQPINIKDTDPPGTLDFFSRGKQLFRAIAKNRHWGQDFWNDLVGPTLKENLNVETWRRGTLASTKDSDHTHDVADVLYINLEPLGVDYEWHYTQDHAKWAISQASDWVCVADMNRDKSQSKRGGGSICFQNKLLWQSLSQVDKLKPTQ